MGYKRVLSSIDELRTIVESWHGEGDPSSLEMDMALDRVKSIYEMLRFPSSIPPEEEVTEEEVAEEEVAEEEMIEEEVAEEEVAEEVIEEAEAEEDDAFELELLNVATISPESGEEVEMVERSVLEREIAAVNQKKRERLDKILSLYDESDETVQSEEASKGASEGASEEELEAIVESVVEELAEEEKRTIVEEEEIGEEATIEEPAVEPEIELEPEIEPEPELAEEIAAEAETEVDGECQLILMLGMNDKILLSQELFGGDVEELLRVLKRLDRERSIDDAMIFIAENYAWSGDNEGAQLLMSLLQNRFLN